MRWTRWMAAASAVVLAATLGACSAAAPTRDADAVFADRMAAALLQWRGSPSTGPFAYTIPGTVLAASIGDGAVVATASGDGAPGVPLDEASTFHIGSMTKLFTAALVMQLDQEGVLSPA